MLTLYPPDRITAAEAINHPWFDDVRMFFPDEEYQSYLFFTVCLNHGIDRGTTLGEVPPGCLLLSVRKIREKMSLLGIIPGSWVLRLASCRRLRGLTICSRIRSI